MCYEEKEALQMACPAGSYMCKQPNTAFKPCDCDRQQFIKLTGTFPSPYSQRLRNTLISKHVVETFNSYFFRETTFGKPPRFPYQVLYRYSFIVLELHRYIFIFVPFARISVVFIYCP